MTNEKKQKQLKITKMFRKGRNVTKPPEDYDEMQAEIQQLEQKLREKQNELFQLQRNSFKCKLSPPKKKPDETFVRPQRIILKTAIERLKREKELMAQLSGTEVQSYVANDHCCVLFHIQYDAENEIKHGLRIDTKAGANQLSATSLPLGFNLAAVLDEDDQKNMMRPESLIVIRNALVAYYDRQEQYQHLKTLVNIEAELFKTLDGSHVEITFMAQGRDEDEKFNVVLMLDYRVCDIWPKKYSIMDSDLPEGAQEALKVQCAVFKEKPLHKAFKQAFMDDIGPYKLVQQGPRPAEERRSRRKRPRQNPYPQHDDTFQPEDCSDPGDDEEYE